MAKTIDIHVDYSGGDDTTGDGSSGSPYKTYDKAITVATAGDVIGLGNNADHVLSNAGDWDTVGSPATVDAPIVTTTWDNAATGDRAVVDCNGGAYGIWTNSDPYLVLDYVEIKNTTTYAVDLTGTSSYYVVSRCVMTNSCGGGINAGSSSAAGRIVGNRITTNDATLVAVFIGGAGVVVLYNVIKTTAANSGRLVYMVGGYQVVAHNVIHTTVSATGNAIELNAAGDYFRIVHNLIIGTSDSGVGITIATGAFQGTIVGNIIQDHGTGIEYNSQWIGYVANNVIYSCTSAEANVPAGFEPDVAHDTTTDPLITDAANGDYTIRESTLLGGLYGLHINHGADQAFGTAGSGDATAEEVADAVLEELISDHSGVAGSLAERMTRIPDVAPAANGGLPTVDANNRIAGIVGTVVNTLDEIAGDAYVEGTHALDQIPSTTDLAADLFTVDSGQSYSTAVSGSVVKEVTADDFYWAVVDIRRDTSQDEYTLYWMNKNGIVSSGSITSPTLQVVKRADGTDLIAQTAVTQIGSTNYYKLDEASNRLTLGQAAIAIATATIGGSSRTWPVIIGRDVAA